MRLVLELFLATVVAVVIGLGSAYYAVEHGHLIDSMWIGDWVASPNAGTPDADPYSAAAFAKTGEVALGSGEGIAFIADRDSNGETLIGACDYKIAGSAPPARLWTLTALGDGWKPAVLANGLKGFHSGDVLRDEIGTFEIILSPSAKSGNWLPIGEVERLRFVIRLYDTPLTSGSSLVELSMPKIHKGACR